MTRWEKTVLGVLIALFLLLGAMLVMSRGGSEHPAKDSLFVKQRMINLQKGK